MKTRNTFLVMGLLIGLVFSSGCPGDNGDDVDTYPDVAGTWDWTVTFSRNDCDGGTGYQVILAITQNGNTGTWTSYDPSDMNCPLEEGTYTIDTSGNVTITLEDYLFDPLGCNGSTPDDAMVSIEITAVATSTQMTGTQTEHWTSEDWGVFDCVKIGAVSATKR